MYLLKKPSSSLMNSTSQLMSSTSQRIQKFSRFLRSLPQFITPPQQRNVLRKRIVISGIGTVNPLGNNVKESWARMKLGESGIDQITNFDPQASQLKTTIAGEVKNFDPSSILSAQEVKRMAPFTQFAIIAAMEALQDAGIQITPENSREIAVFLGMSISGGRDIEEYRPFWKKDGKLKIPPAFSIKVDANRISSEVSRILGIHGFNGVLNTACSSANHTIGMGAGMIALGQAKMVLVGGAESANSSAMISAMNALTALSTRNGDPSRASRPYDQDRDGFVLAEGSGVLLLEEYEHAKTRGAKIYAELIGYGFNSDGYHQTRASVEWQAEAMKMAMRDAQIQAEDIDYISTHGTSTPVGDLLELQALEIALGNNALGQVSISALKSMIGHTLGAAGGIEAVMIMKMMEESFILPTINVENPDPECKVDITPNQGKSKKINIAMNNSFGFGGSNAITIFKKL